jgi:hypothetical protein
MAAVAGQFVKLDSVPTRKVVRVVLEMPIEAANDVLRELGGYPDAANAKWVGVALLTGEPSENTLKGGKLAQRAGILCDQGAFKTFARESGYDDPVKMIYARCDITSRAHLDHDTEAARAFHELDLEYQAWMRAA